MKHLFLALVAFCITACNSVPTPVSADAPQPGILKIALTSNTISLGEPLILKYQISNAENRRVSVYMGKDKQAWLSMRLNDASGHPVQALPDSTYTRGSIHSDGVDLDALSHNEGYVVISQKFRLSYPSQYRLTLTTHLIYSWDDMSDEKYADDQEYSLPVTVTAKNPQKLLAVAEALRQTVLHDVNVAENQAAIKALFAMGTSDCLPVWQELANDPTLDPWRAVEVAQQLGNAGTISASDILAEMQLIAPERWGRTGTSPSDVLKIMRRSAGPKLKQHINQLLAQASIPPVSKHTKMMGSVN